MSILFDAIYKIQDRVSLGYRAALQYVNQNGYVQTWIPTKIPKENLGHFKAWRFPRPQHDPELEKVFKEIRIQHVIERACWRRPWWDFLNVTTAWFAKRVRVHLDIIENNLANRVQILRYTQIT